MQIDRFDRLVWAIIGILIVSIIGLIWGAGQVGIPVETTIPQAGGEAGMLGPISIEFPQVMEQSSVEALFSISPTVTGEFRWFGNTMQFIPNQAFQPGENYTARLLPGSVGEDKRRIKEELIWSFTVREPWITYLSAIEPGREVFRIPLSGGDLERLTYTEGRIFDFAPSVDGEQIAYSLVNAENGIDIWTMARDGSSPQMLVDCGLHRCSTPAWSPDGTRIAYSRSEAGLGPNAPYSAARVWLVDLTTGETDRVFADTQRLGHSPYWSPDGTHLAYMDGVNNQILVVELESGREILLPSRLGSAGSWSPDGQKMLYGDILVDANDYVKVIYQADLAIQDTTIIYGNLPGDNQYGEPQWSPEGDWIAVSIWSKDSLTDRELMILSAGDVFGFTIADDPSYIYSNYHFDPGESFLVYQRLALAGSYVQPEILLYDIDRGVSSVLASNASFPAWLP